MADNVIKTINEKAFFSDYEINVNNAPTVWPVRWVGLHTPKRTQAQYDENSIFPIHFVQSAEI